MHLRYGDHTIKVALSRHLATILCNQHDDVCMYSYKEMCILTLTCILYLQANQSAVQYYCLSDVIPSVYILLINITRGQNLLSEIFTRVFIIVVHFLLGWDIESNIGRRLSALLCVPPIPLWTLDNSLPLTPAPVPLPCPQRVCGAITALSNPYPHSTAVSWFPSHGCCKYL